MKRFTEFKELSIEQAAQVTGIIKMEGGTDGYAKSFIDELTKVAKKVQWSAWEVFRIRRRWNLSQDLTKPLH